MSDPFFDWFWKTTLLPGGITFVLALAAALILRDRSAQGWRGLPAFLGSAAALLGGIVAYLALNGWPGEFPPTSSWQWIIHISLAALPICAIEAFLPRAAGAPALIARWIVRVLFAGFAVGAVFWSLWKRDVLGPEYQAVPWVALALAIAACWPWERAEARGLRGFFLAGALAAWAGCGSIMLILAETARLGQVAGAFACALSALLIPAALRNPAAKSLPAAVAGWLPMWLAALCAVGYWSTDSTNMVGFLLLGLAPWALVLWPRAAEPFSYAVPKGRELTFRIVALALYGLALLGALGISIQHSLQESATSEEDAYMEEWY